MTKLMTPKVLQEIKGAASISHIRQNPHVAQSYIMALLDHIEAITIPERKPIFRGKSKITKKLALKRSTET